MSILDFLRVAGKHHRKLDGEFGIEIETETKKEYVTPAFAFWEAHGDGSLRDFGIEYVLRQPVKYNKELDQALDEFRDKTKEIKFIPDSVTTSVHVHVNMLNETFKTLGNFLTLYALFENLLIRYSGEDRRSNLFCLPICDAEETYRVIVELFKQIQGKNYKGLALPENQVKYAACNLATLWKFGSVEIRSFRGETDTAKIKNWVTLLYRMLQYARTDINPKNIMLSWKDRQLALLNDVFTDYRPEIKHIDELKLIEKNTWYAACIAFSVRHWEQLDEPLKIPEFKPKQKELDLTAMQLFAVQFDVLDAADQQHVLHFLQKAWNQKHGLDVKFVPNQVQRPAPIPVRRREEFQRAQINIPAGDFNLAPGEIINHQDPRVVQAQADANAAFEAEQRRRDQQHLDRLAQFAQDALRMQNPPRDRDL